jgi:acyl transferase domain-containing protein
MNDALNGTEIAIIGMAGRFPGAATLDAFWQNLHEGVESISFLDDATLAARGVDPATRSDPSFVRATAELDGVELFDAAFFTMNPREAEITDPQHRVFLECAWESLESAGYTPERYQGVIGVYAGATINTYLLLHLAADPELLHKTEPLQLNIGNGGDFLTTRASYKLNLKGPSHLVQSACSTSLVAVHVACQSLLHEECDMALAGGVSINLSQRNGYAYQSGGMVSPDGHCRAFDAQAQGTVFGSGVGLVVLKRLADALADGDTIHAVIKGSAINNDGALKVGYIAPSVDGQAEVIAEALANAGVGATTISYVEAHGTATPLGDPIEIAALTKAFRATTDRNGFCAIGSVKTNIGHLDAAAGVAGLIKTVLALKHRQLPPSLHFRSANPNIDFANTPFYVNAALAPWPSGRQPRRAGVSAFGVGGTNAHVILEEAPPSQPGAPARPWQLLTLSAKIASALEATHANLAAYLHQHPRAELADVAYTLHVGRQAFSHRRALVCRDHADALRLLAGAEPQRVFSAVAEPTQPAIVFMFPGQGAQYARMAHELYRQEPVFRAVIDECAKLLVPHMGRDLREVIYPRDEGRTTEGESEASFFVVGLSSDAASTLLDQTQYAQPALFVVEYALAQLWMAWGVQPQALIGHSIGEYVAACLAGVLTLVDALALVAARGRLMQAQPAGAMLAVPLPEDELRYLLGADLALAAINGPTMCVVAGPLAALAALEQQLTAEGISCRRLATSHAFHSQMVEPMIEAFAGLVGAIALWPPQIPYISNVTGTWIRAEEATDPRYWTRHLRQTVRFGSGIHELLHDPARIMLEVGPGQTLSRLVRRNPRYRSTQLVLATLPPRDDPQPEQAYVLGTLGRLWLAGVPVDWPGVYGKERRQRLPLPTYPFERQRYWIAPAERAVVQQRPVGKRPDIADWFFLPTWQRTLLPRTPAALGATPRCWLVFAGADDISTALIDRLTRTGQTVVSVAAGQHFERHSAASYCIDPCEPDHYAALICELHDQDRAPSVIAHLWSITMAAATPAAATPAAAAPAAATMAAATPAAATMAAATPLDPAHFAEHQQLSCYSLLWLAQALGARASADRVALLVVSNQLHDLTGDEPLRPEKATLLGPCKVIPQEYPQISCQVIDVTLPPPGTRQASTLIDQLLAEVATGAAEAVVAYRGDRRWVQRFEPVRLTEAAEAGQALRENGVYVISGGLAGIGLQLANYLAQTVRARLILLDHADASRDQIVQALEAAGAQVVLVSDDGEQTQRGLAQAVAQCGALHGVIHAAGADTAQSFAMIQDLDMAHCQALFQPKFAAALALANLLQGWSPDFCLVVSSLASILGGLGAAAYTAANLFLDAFAHQQNQTSGTPWISANWDTWQLPVAQTQAAVAGSQAQQFALTPDEGRETFRRIIATRMIDQVVVSTGDLATRIAQWITRESLPDPADQQAMDASTTLHPRPKLQTPYVAPESALEQAIAAIWQRALGIAQVGVLDHFFELGGDSLVAIQVTQALKRELNITIPVVSLYEALTIRAMLALLGAEQPGEPPSQAAQGEMREEKGLRRKKYQQQQRAESKQRRRS